MNKETADNKAKELITKARTETTWSKKLIYWLAGILLAGASAYYLTSCSVVDKYDVDYNHDSATSPSDLDKSTLQNNTPCP